MSLHLTIYVGPFLRCKRKPGSQADAYELTNGRMHNLRGELSTDDGNIEYVGPNVAMPEITRALRFEQFRDTPVVSGINRGEEVMLFILQFSDEIKVLKKEFESVSVEWGVTPGYF